MTKEPEWSTEAYPTVCPKCAEVVYLRELRTPNPAWKPWPLDRTGKNHLASCDGFQGWISGNPGPHARKVFKEWVDEVRAEAKVNPDLFVDRKEAIKKMKEDQPGVP